MCNDLANSYQSQVRYAESEPLYKRCRAILEKALGAEHPDVGQLLKNLAVLTTSNTMPILPAPF